MHWQQATSEGKSRAWIHRHPSPHIHSRARDHMQEGKSKSSHGKGEIPPCTSQGFSSSNPNMQERLFTGGAQMNSITVNTSHHQEQFSLTAGAETVTAARHHCQKNHQMRNSHVPGIPPGCWADTIYTVIFDSSITQFLKSNCVPLE